MTWLKSEIERIERDTKYIREVTKSIMHNKFTQSEATEVLDYLLCKETSLSFEVENKMMTLLHPFMPKDILTGEKGTPLFWYHDYFSKYEDKDIVKWVLEHSEEGVKL